MCQEFSRHIGKLGRIFLNFLGKKNIQVYSQEIWGEGEDKSKSDERVSSHQMLRLSNFTNGNKLIMV